MLRTIKVLAGCALALVLSPAPAGALSEMTAAVLSPETGCERAKLRAAAHYFGCLTRTHEKANAQSEEPSKGAIAHCDERFDRAFEQAEARGFCRTPGGASTLRGPLRAGVQRLANILKAETGCTELTITPGNIATCTVNKTTSAIDLATIVDQLSGFGVTDDTTLWIQAWGGNGSNGNVCCEWGGRGGQGGYAQTTMSVNALESAYGTTELYYYLGTNGTFAADAGGDGGTATLATVNNLTQGDVDPADTLVIAGGGGGGGAGRGTGACAGGRRIRGAAGGDGASAFFVSGLVDFWIVAGGDGAAVEGVNNSGRGGQVATGGSNNGGSSTPGDGPTAPLGGRGGNHLSPQIGFVNASGTQVTGGGGRGSDGGNLAGGGGGGGGFTGGGGGNRGVSATDCFSGGGGGGSSFVRQVPDSPTCSAAPTMRPDNPNGIEGFVQITFDLGACG